MAATEYSELPLPLRAKAYRNLAGEARREAERSEAMAGQSYLVIAEQWDRLAADIERYLESKEETAALLQSQPLPGSGTTLPDRARDQ